MIDNTTQGKGKAGTRLAPTVTVREVARLARAMVWKWAAADLYYGGAMADIRCDVAADKEAVVRAFARALSNEVPSEYVIGLETGLTEDDAANIVDELGYPAAVGAPSVLGGIPYDEFGVTGFGVAEAACAASQWSRSTAEGARVAIHGLVRGARPKGPNRFPRNMCSPMPSTLWCPRPRRDMIANAGGAIAAAFAMESPTSPFVADHEEIFATIKAKAHSNTATVLDSSRRTSPAPHAAARALAQERVRSTMIARGQKAPEGIFIS